MSTVKDFKKRRKELKAQINATRALLDKLESQLEQEREEMQHDEVDHLDKWLDKAEPKRANLIGLAEEVLSDLRKKLQHTLHSNKPNE